MDKKQCRNCWHGSHGSTDMDSCHAKDRLAGFGSKATCNCKVFVLYDKEQEAKEEAERIDACEIRLAKEHGVENHPKRSRLWAMAWDHGHSSGLSEVEIYYNDFVELLK